MALALLDTMVLVYAAFHRTPLHEAAARLVDRGLRCRWVFCIAPQNLVEFAAVVTRRRRDETPLSAADIIRMSDRLYRSRILTKSTRDVAR